VRIGKYFVNGHDETLFLLILIADNVKTSKFCRFLLFLRV